MFAVFEGRGPLNKLDRDTNLLDRHVEIVSGIKRGNRHFSRSAGDVVTQVGLVKEAAFAEAEARRGGSTNASLLCGTRIPGMTLCCWVGGWVGRWVGEWVDGWVRVYMCVTVCAYACACTHIHIYTHPRTPRTPTPTHTPIHSHPPAH